MAKRPLAPILEHDSPYPLVLGAYSLTGGVRVVLCLHFVLCAFIISTMSSVAEFSLGHWYVPVKLQIFLASWCVVGVMLIAGALSAVSARQEWPLRLYCYYNFVCLLMCMGLLVYVGSEGAHCDSIQSNKHAQRIGNKLACGMFTALVVVILLATFAIQAYMTFICWQLRECFWDREQSEQLIIDEDSIESKLSKGGHAGAGGRHLGMDAGHGHGGHHGHGHGRHGHGGGGHGGRAGGYGGAGGYAGSSGYGGGGFDGDSAFGDDRSELGSNAGDGYSESGGSGAPSFGGGDFDPAWAQSPGGVQPAWGNMQVKTTAVF